MRVLRRHQAQELDHISMKEMGIPGVQLMGKAGEKVAHTVKEILGLDTRKKIAICCGKGNNGGDGFAAALYLDQYNLTIYSLIEPKDILGDSKHYFDLCKEKNITIIHGLDIPTDSKYDLVIDALLGTGFHGEMRSPFSEWLKWINDQESTIVSVDIPSGVDADTGSAAKEAIHADFTVTMGNVKTGLVLNPGSSLTGIVIPVDIGFPDIYDQLSGLTWTMFTEDVCHQYLKPPKKDTYKHQQGKVLIIAGSKGMTGAASLATYGALRVGAGLTVTCAPESLNTIYESNILEGMTLVCPDEGEGYFSENNYEDMECMFDWADVLLIGPGLGGNPSTVRLVEKIVTNLNIPLVIDADALRIIVDNHTILKNINTEFVLTPHYGEFAAMLGKDQKTIKKEFPILLEDFLSKLKGVIIAKNAPTCVGTKKNIVINSSGNQGLATAGTGDVLAGMTAGFISQGIPSFVAAQIAVFIHGKAADQLVGCQGYRGQIASDLLTEIPKVIRQYEIE